MVDPERPESKPKAPHSQTINIHGPVTGSTIQQGDHNIATLNYQHDVERILEEIRPLLNAAKLMGEDSVNPTVILTSIRRDFRLHIDCIVSAAHTRLQQLTVSRGFVNR